MCFNLWAQGFGKECWYFWGGLDDADHVTLPPCPPSPSPPKGDKLHVAPGSTHSHQQQQQQHHHLQHQHQQQQHRVVANHVQGRAASCSGPIPIPTAVAAKTLQASGLLPAAAQGGPLCPGPSLTLPQLAHFKPGTFNITKGGKITMQPVSVTIPLVGPMGLGALAAAAPSQLQNPHQHPHQPTLLVTTTTADDVRAGVGAAGGGVKTEILLHPQISTASGLIS